MTPQLSNKRCPKHPEMGAIVTMVDTFSEYNVIRPCFITIYDTRSALHNYIQRLLVYLEIQYEINHIYCTICKDHFRCLTDDPPEKCQISFHKLIEYLRPDFMIVAKNIQCQFILLKTSIYKIPYQLTENVQFFDVC